MKEYNVSESDGNYNVDEAKIRCSVTWLLAMVKMKHGSFNVGLMFDEGGKVTKDLQDFLVSGWPYRECIRMIFNDNILNNGFDDVIQVLCRHEFYVLKENDAVLTSEQLTQCPINLRSHVQLIEMLQAAYSKSWMPIDKVVGAVKLFSSFYASRESPGNTGEALVLWLRKVVTKIQQLEQTSEPHQWLKRIFRTPGDGNPEYPVVTSQLDDICDSAVLALLLHYYSPDHVVLKDIALKATPSLADATHNLTLSLEFIFSEVFTPGIPQYLTPDDFINCHEDLRPNFVAFFTQLFHCLEITPTSGKIAPRGHKVKILEKKEILQPIVPVSTVSDASHRSSSVLTQLQNVSELISDATKRSFLSNEQKPIGKHSTNLLTTSSQSESDLRLPMMGIPQKPLLPRRQHEERPRTTNPSYLINENGPIRKATSLHNITHQPIKPSTWRQASPGRKQWNQPSVTQHNLLSKVEMDQEIDVLLSDASSSLGAGDSRDVDLSWKGFTLGKPPTSVSSAWTNSDDITIETVRTNDFRSPISTSRGFYAQPLLSHNRYDDTASELTNVSTITASTSTGESTAKYSVEPRTASPEKSTKAPTKTHLGNSYIVQSGAFNSMESARAAGYPVISEASVQIKSSVSHESGIHRNNKLPRTISFAEVASQTDPPCPPNMGDLESKLAQALQQFNDIKLEINRMKPGYTRDQTVNSNLDQLKRLKSLHKPLERTKEESSSDYSSKSPSPASTTREQTPVFQAKSHLTKILDNIADSSGDSTLCEGSNSATVQQKLDQIRRSVEKQRQKRVDFNQNNPPAITNSFSGQGNPQIIFSSSPNKSTEMTQQNFGTTQQNLGMTQHNFGMTQQNLGMSQQSFGTTQPNLHMSQHSTMPTQQMDDGRHGSITTGSRRALFPHNGPGNDHGDHGDSPDRLQVTKAPHEISVTYDSFTDRLQSTSCKSTPAKSAPASPSSADHDIELTLNDSDKKGLGFTIIQEKSPATEIAKKKEKFLLSRLKKEEEMRKKQIEREAELESKKREARAREEAAQQKKTEERMKRDQRLREFQLRKKLEEEAANPNPGVIGGSSGRKPTNKSKTYHIPTEQATSIQNLLDLDSPTNYAVADLNSAKPSTHPNGDHDGEDTGSNGSGGSSEYKGPKLFKKLSSKSNRALIHNALSHCCLPGKVNESARLKILQELEQSEARHLMVLFRDNKCQYRALYSYNPETEKLTKINGTGPHTISAYMILSLFKYNSGRRAFTCVPSKTLSVSIDAITIKQSLWQKR